MKKVITILLITCSFSATSQYLKSGTVDSTTAATSGSTSPFLLSTGSVRFAGTEPDEHKKDTITIIMLVSDTSTYRGFTTSMYIFNPIGRAEQEHHSLNWIHGYATRDITISKKGQHQDGFYMWYQQADYPSYRTTGYLDDEQRPLPKEIVVWQVK